MTSLMYSTEYVGGAAYAGLGYPEYEQQDQHAGHAGPAQTGQLGHQPPQPEQWGPAGWGTAYQYPAAMQPQPVHAVQAAEPYKPYQQHYQATPPATFKQPAASALSYAPAAQPYPLHQQARPASQPSALYHGAAYSGAPYLHQHAQHQSSLQYAQPSIIQYNPQHVPTQTSVLHQQQPAFAPPPRPLSAQPAPPAPHHHPTCSCRSCRPQEAYATHVRAPSHVPGPSAALPALPAPPALPALGLNLSLGLGASQRPQQEGPEGPEGPPAKRMRTDRVETVSPVDLSVRTVRRSADSTAWQAEHAHVRAVTQDCDSTAPPRPTTTRPRRTAVMPRMDFMPDFSVAHFYQQEAAPGPRRDPPPPPQPAPASPASPPRPQVSLPGMSTLPWAVIPRGGAADLAGHQSHSPLLPRFSSNRSSLYPSSSAPALPAHAADPTGYLQDGPPAPAPAPPAAPAAPDVPEVPARIRTKAEMKMLGDAAAEAVRSWLATASPDPNEPVCEASTSGLSASPPEQDCHLDSAEDIAKGASRLADAPKTPPRAAPRAEALSPPVLCRAVSEDATRTCGPLDAVLDAMASPSVGAAVTTPSPVSASARTRTALEGAGRVIAPAEGWVPPLASTRCSRTRPSPSSSLRRSAAPEVTATSTILDSAASPTSVLEMPKLEAMVSPRKESPTPTASTPAVTRGVEGYDDSSQGAWAQSCLDFELELEANEPKRKLSNRFLGEEDQFGGVIKNVSKTEEPSPKTQVLVKRHKDINLNSHITSPSKARESSTHVSKSKRRQTEENGSDSSASSDEDNAALTAKHMHQPEKTVTTRSSKVCKNTSPAAKKQYPHKDTPEKKNVCTKSRASAREGETSFKPPLKTRGCLSKDISPGEKNSPPDIKNEPHSPELVQATKTSERPVFVNDPEIPQDSISAGTHCVKIRLRTKIVEVERAYSLRPKGDGSDFRPGWEEEVFQYKRSLRMPQVLINMSKGSISSEREYSKSPSVCSASESMNDNTPMKHLSRPSSEIDGIDMSSNFHDVESEDASSSISLPASVISRRSKRSIVDQLVEKVSKVSAGKNKTGNLKRSEHSSGKVPKSSINIEKQKGKQLNIDIKNLSVLSEDIKGKLPFLSKDGSKSISEKAEDSIKAVFGAEKAFTTKSQSKKLEENNKRGKSKAIQSRRRTDSVPVMQISLRKRNLIIPKPTNKRSCSKYDASQNEGIVLRPRNVQLTSSSRSGTRSAALIRRSKVVLNSKIRKIRDETTRTQSRDSEDLEPVNESTKNEADGNTCGVNTESTPTNVVRKRVKLRRKFRSGFDYIRKKKKVKKNVPQKPVVEKATVPVERTPMSEEQIQSALRNWVVNRSHGDTVLHRAARLGYAEVAEYAIRRMKMSPRIADNAGFTPLHEAARRGHVALSRILLEYGADASSSAKGGVRPLHEAAESNQVEMLRLLLEFGADATIATYANQTPLSIVEPGSEAHHLLELHLADVRGQPALPWKYQGPSKIFDPTTYKDDLALQSPPSVENVLDEEIDVISSEVTPPALYYFCGEPASQLWVLITDLMEVLNIFDEDEIMARLGEHQPDGPSSSQNLLTQTREISVEDFLLKAKAVTFSASLSNLPTSGYTTRLIEYSSRVRDLLNEEITTVG